MKPVQHLPRRIVALSDDSLLPLLSQSGFSVPYAVISGEGLGPIMGFPWWCALAEGLTVPTIFDAGYAASLAAYALREGQKWVVCTADAPSIETVRDIARQCGGHLLTTRPAALALGRPPYNAYRIGQLHQYLAPES